MEKITSNVLIVTASLSGPIAGDTWATIILVVQPDSWRNIAITPTTPARARVGSLLV